MWIVARFNWNAEFHVNFPFFLFFFFFFCGFRFHIHLNNKILRKCLKIRNLVISKDTFARMQFVLS